jgi:hypothetical protein
LNLPPPDSSRYAELIARLDAFDVRVQAAQRTYLRCASGCDGCCRLRRTAFPVEVAAIRHALTTLPPERVEALRARRDAADVKAGARCVFLEGDGRCAVYAARPVVCRTHGPAIRTSEGLSWCKLNFDGLGPGVVEAGIPASAVMNLDLVNQMLVLIDAEYRSGLSESASLPIRLDLAEALSP